MSQPRMDEDALVRAVDFCEERGYRFGQFVVDAISEMRQDVGASKGEDTIEKKLAVVRTLFYIENERLEQLVRGFIEKSNRQRAALDQMARDAVAEGLYDLPREQPLP